MNTKLHIEPGQSNAYALSEALYFGTDEHRLFGWLHRCSREVSPSVGLVVCKPFGYEAICAHRSLRAFAESAAASGVPTLRFDYLGTGDSADIAPEVDQLETWTADVLAAIQELQRLTGVERVCLLGVRFGALVALLAAERNRSAVAELVLIAPIINGRRFIRELRTTRLAANLEAAPQFDNVQGGGIEVGGFSLSAATLAALVQLDMTNPTSSPAPDIVVIDSSDLPVSRDWTESLSKLGVRTSYQALPGLTQMLVTAPQFGEIPREAIGVTCDWLTQTIKRTSQPINAARLSIANTLPSNTQNILTLCVSASSPRSAVTEQPVFFGPETLLFGILTEPQQGERRRRAVIFLNVGADHHIGASRLYVTLARRWARRGYIVLRMDFAGLGDSGVRNGRPVNEVFPAEAIQDISSAIDYLRRRYDGLDVTLAGLCSGAYHALRAAVAGLQVNRILLINPQNYFWKAGSKVDDLQIAEVVRNPTLYQKRVLSVAAWKRLLTGDVNIVRIVKILVQRPLLALECNLRNMARMLRVHLANDLGWDLETLALRGVQVVFVFARNEPGIDLLKLQAGSSIGRVGTSCRIHVLEAGDHVFSKSGSRYILEKVLDAELFSRIAAEDGAPNASQSESTSSDLAPGEMRDR
jgi:alpha-beta hydrolase superfamily lysophospholipase